MNAVDVLLFEKLDVYRRLTMTFEDATERFWRQFGKTLGAIIKDVVGPTIEETFSTAGYGSADTGRADRKEWVLDFGGAGEDLEEWERAPSFWFPNEAGDFDIFALTGLDEDWSMEAVIWGQPLSRFAGDVTSAQKLV